MKTKTILIAAVVLIALMYFFGGTERFGSDGALISLNSNYTPMDKLYLTGEPGNGNTFNETRQNSGRWWSP